LFWSLSVDWFNPHGNKAAEKAVSTGSVAMACLNLSPSLWYKVKNVFLAAVMLKKPSVEEVGNYIEPLVKMLDKLWKNDTKFAHIESSEHGRTMPLMLTMVVSDLPASRKINGVAGHSAKKIYVYVLWLGMRQYKQSGLSDMV
jgi:Transposase family tnp2